MNIDTTQLNGRKLSNQQFRKLQKIVNFFEHQVCYPGSDQTFNVKVTIDDYFAWVSVRTRRTDSPKQVLTEEGGFFSITPRGKIAVWSCYALLGEEKKKHYARMLGANLR